jgi:MerR family transcriptional regulator, light-induced transcriptional regulator
VGWSNRDVAAWIVSRLDELAHAVVEEQLRRQPNLSERYGERELSLCRQDTVDHLRFLGQAIEVSQPALFVNYVGWANTLLNGLGVPPDELVVNLQAIEAALSAALPSEAGAIVRQYVDAGLASLLQDVDEPPSFIDESCPGGLLARRYLDLLLRGERQAASGLVLDAVEAGFGVKDVYLRVFQPTMEEIGRLWQLNRVSVAQEHYCTAVTQMIMSQLTPRLFSTPRIGRSAVAACVGSELHEIGIRMVADLLESDGWDTCYLGANTPTRSVVRTVVERKPDLLAISATISYHVSGVTELVRAVRSEAAVAGVKILVGGYPFNVARDLWRQTGADGFARNAEDSIEVARRLVSGQRSVDG